MIRARFSFVCFLVAWPGISAQLSQGKPGPLAALPAPGSGGLFKSVIGIGMERKMPIEIILGEDRSICSIDREIDPAGGSVQDQSGKVLEASGYQATMDGDLLKIAPDPTHPAESRVLNIVVDRFNPAPQPMHVLGAFLVPQIEAKLHPGQGSAGSFLSSSRARDIVFQSMTNATVEQIADRIINEDGKGIWIMRFRRDPDGSPDSETLYAFETYSYDDDAAAIRELDCNR